MRDSTKQKAKKVLASLLALALFAALFGLVSNIFLEKEPAYYKYRNYNALPEGTVDILYVGNSHFNAAIDAERIDEAIGGTFGFSYGVTGMRMDYAYYRFQNALRTQSPKLVVLDTFCLVPIHEDERAENLICWPMDGIPLSADKVEAVTDLVPPDEWPDYFVPFIKYHARWDSLAAEDVVTVFDKSAHSWLGRRPETTDAAMDHEDDHFERDVAAVEGELPISASHAPYLERFIALARQQGAQVLLLTVPYRQQFGLNSTSGGAQLNNYLRAHYVDDDAVRLLDVNAHYRELAFSYDDMRDDGHVNFSGSEKTSLFFAEYVKNTYGDNYF